MGKFMATVLPTSKFSLLGHDFSLNPGPFNIKEHALIGIAVATGFNAAHAIDILSATDIYLGFRVNAPGSLLMIITTQNYGYGMAGMAGILRKYLVYPAEMVWRGNLVQVVFYNTLHKTDDFSRIKMVRGWSRMRFFWVVVGVMFFYQVLPQWLASILLYFDWLCWINPFNHNFWAFFSSVSGACIFSLSFDWTSLGGSAMYLPLSAQLCVYGGAILSY